MKTTLLCLIAFSLFWASPLRADEEEGAPPSTEEKPVLLETIVVTAKMDYCEIPILAKRMNKSSSYSYGGLLQPGHSVCSGDCPNFFHALMNLSVVKNFGGNETFEIETAFASCKRSECSRFFAKYPAIKFKIERPEDTSLEYASYSILQKYDAHQMYDADFKNIEVSCPPENCYGIVYESRDGRMFYTATKKSDGKVEERLVVNGGINSKFVTESKSQIFEKCSH